MIYPHEQTFPNSSTTEVTLVDEYWSKKHQRHMFWTGGLVSAVQQVDAVDVVLAHLSGRTKHRVGVWNSHHGGVVVVFGESQP